MSGGSLTLAAADGFRLAVRILDVPDGTPDLQMIVPARTLTEVARLLPDTDDEVAISTTAERQPGLFRVRQNRNHQSG